MTRGRWLAATALAVSIAGGAWFGGMRLDASPTAAPAPKRAAAPAAPTEAQASQVEEVGTPDRTGETPMAQRVAVIGFLNKRNGEARELVMKPGQAFRVGEAIVRLRACEQTAPWEQDQLTGAFLQLDVQGTDRRWRRAFSGWTFKERPSLNVVQNGVYDVWPKSCTMRFPSQGADTEAAPSAAPKASNARKSPPARAPSSGRPPSDPPSAEPSNAI